MSRSIRIITPSSLTTAILEELRKISGLVSISLARGAALEPSGDIVTVETTNRALPKIMLVLEEKGLLDEPGGAVSTFEPDSIISVEQRDRIATDVSDASPEEMDQMLARESNMTLNGMLLMGLAGVIASVGLTTGTLHTVLAGMLIAPGFEPLSRIAYGVADKSKSALRGLSYSLKAYASLIVGATLAALAVRLGDSSPVAPAYQMPDALITFWSVTSVTSSALALVAGIAAALLIATNRSILTAGAQMLIGLIPSSALIGVGIAALDGGLIAAAGFRLLVDMSLVVIGSALTFAWKRARVHRRSAHM